MVDGLSYLNSSLMAICQSHFVYKSLQLGLIAIDLTIPIHHGKARIDHWELTNIVG